ncbi:MAG: substrate-binding domain-containing protein, partial [Planctomycetota bacterium]
MKFFKPYLCMILVIACVGCRDNQTKESATSAEKLMLYCGAGIQPPAAELAEIFAREHNIEIETNYAGSEVLLSTIKLNRRGDLYMPGDKHYTEQAAKEGLILSTKSVCYFVPTILIQKGNPKKIAGLKDLIKPGV